MDSLGKEDYERYAAVKRIVLSQFNNHQSYFVNRSLGLDRAFGESETIKESDRKDKAAIEDLITSLKISHRTISELLVYMEDRRMG